MNDYPFPSDCNLMVVQVYKCFGRKGKTNENIDNPKVHFQGFKIYNARNYQGLFLNLLNIGFFNSKKT